MEEVIHNVLGGSVTTRPAGVFIDRENNNQEINYKDAVVVTIGRKSVTIPVEHARALCEAGKASKEFANEIGFKSGLL